MLTKEQMFDIIKKKKGKGAVMSLKPSDITDEEVMTYLGKVLIEGPIPDMDAYRRYKRCEYTATELEIVRKHLVKHPEIIDSIRRGDKVFFHPPY